MQFYKYPRVRCLMLIPEQVDTLQDSHSQLIGKYLQFSQEVIKFSDGHINLGNSGRFSTKDSCMICCPFKPSLPDTELILTFTAVFYCSIEDTKHGAAVISSRTHVVFSQHESGGCFTQVGSSFILAHCQRSKERDFEILQYYKELGTSLLGSAHNLLRNDTARHNASIDHNNGAIEAVPLFSKVNSILLHGPSGSGLTTLAYSVARSYDVPVVVVSPAHALNIIGTGKADTAGDGSGGGAASRTAEFIHKAVMCAVAMQPCVLVLDNLQQLLPSSVVGTKGGALKSEPRLEEVKQAILRELENFPKLLAAQHHVGPPPKVVLIGCYCTSFHMMGSGGSGSDSGINEDGNGNGNASHEQLSVPRGVTALFDECFHAPLPFASQRRAICRQVYDNWKEAQSKNEANGVIFDMDDTALGALADKWTAQPTVTLCVRIKTYLNKVQRSLEFDQSSSAATTALAPAAPLNIQSPQQLQQQQQQQKQQQQHRSPRRQQQVFGQQAAKKALYEAIVWPRKYAKLIQEFSCGVTGNNQEGQATTHDSNQSSSNTNSSTSDGGNVGVLLFGPPGTGKTLIPRVLNTQLFEAFENDIKKHPTSDVGTLSNSSSSSSSSTSSPQSRGFVIEVRMRSVLRGEIGTGEKALVDIFNTAKRNAPSIIFIDEFQAAFTSRTGDKGGGGARDGVGFTLSATLAGCLDDLREWNSFAGLESTVVVLAATNEPWAVDPAFLRPGRLDECVFVGPLDVEGREAYARHLVCEQWETVFNSGCWRGRNHQHHVAVDDADDAGVDFISSSYCESSPSSSTITELVSVLMRGTEGFTGADMKLLGIRALRELLRSREDTLMMMRQEGAIIDEEKASTIVNSDDDDDDEREDSIGCCVGTGTDVGALCTCLSEAALSDELQCAYQAALLTCECSVSDEEVYEYLLWQRDR